MAKFIIVLFCLILFCTCNYYNKNKKETSDFALKDDSIKYKNLYGTWVRHDKSGFALIEINGKSDVVCYGFGDRKASNDTIAGDRFYYNKSKAKLGFWDKTRYHRGLPEFYINTDKYRFDFIMKGDTIIEVDKMGEQGAFIKVYTDEQKDFKIFNQAKLNGEISYPKPKTIDSIEYIILNNSEYEYRFTSFRDKGNNYKSFSDLAELGDSVIKIPFSETLILKKNQTKKDYKFRFLKR